MATDDHNLQVDYFTKAIQLNSFYPRAHFNRAEAYWQLNRYGEALADYTRAIEMEPTLGNAYWGRGDVKKAQGQPQAALPDFDKAIELDVNNANIYYGRGNLKIELKRYAQAIVDFDKAISIDAKYVSAYNSRGNARYYLGNYEMALADYNQAIDLDAKYAEAYCSKGQALVKLARYQEALDAFAKGEALDKTITYHLADKKVAQDQVNAGATTSQTAKYWFDKGMATDNHTLEVEYFTKAIDLDPTYSKAHFNRGVAKRALGRNEDAIADYDRAIELEPNYAPAYNNRALVKYQLGRYDAALSDYNQANLLDPSYARAWFNKGQTLVRLQHYAEALDAFNKGEALDKTITYHLDDEKLARERLQTAPVRPKRYALVDWQLELPVWLQPQRPTSQRRTGHGRPASETGFLGNSHYRCSPARDPAGAAGVYQTDQEGRGSAIFLRWAWHGIQRRELSLANGRPPGFPGRCEPGSAERAALH